VFGLRHRLPSSPAFTVLSRGLVAVLLLGSCGGGTQPAAIAASSQHTRGPLADTWYGDGPAWRELAGPHPSPRYGAELAYDVARKDFVLFGGQSASVSYDETWTFDGQSWKREKPAHKPPPRRDAAMAFDRSLQLVVLYGGLIPNGAEGVEAGDTWTWDGSDWTQVSADNKGPHLRVGAKLVTADDRVILFGGHVFNTSYFGDAWTFDGSTWVRVDHNPSPAGRGDAAVAWNPDDSSLLVVGGLGFRAGAGPGNLGVPLSDAWSLIGGSWSRLTASNLPSLYDASAIWDQKAHSVVVMFGMNCPNPVNDAWAWNGSVWARSTLPIPARWSAATAVDMNGNILVFGGEDEVGC
jgi:hypothetical protein